jgi:hypothetical protein
MCLSREDKGSLLSGQFAKTKHKKKHKKPQAAPHHWHRHRLPKIAGVETPSPRSLFVSGLPKLLPARGHSLFANKHNYTHIFQYSS